MSYDPTTHATEHFSWAELDPTGKAGPGSRANLHRLANDILEPLRVHLGEPVSVTSGYRDISEQQAIWDRAVREAGGDETKAREHVAPPGHSQHNLGNAADLAFPTEAARERLVAYLVTNPAVGGIGLYPWGVHVDRRPRDGDVIARW